MVFLFVRKVKIIDDEFYKYVQTITGIVYNKDKQMIKLI
jgi:hypothetical protein